MELTRQEYPALVAPLPWTELIRCHFLPLNDGDPNPVRTDLLSAGSYKLAVMDKYCPARVPRQRESKHHRPTGYQPGKRYHPLCKGETLLLRVEGGGITLRWDNGSGGPSSP